MTEHVPGPDEGLPASGQVHRSPHGGVRTGAPVAEDPARDPAAHLTQRDAAILAFEASSVRGPERDREIRERFDMSPTRYHQVLNRLIDTPAALQHDPLLVQRLRRVREARQRARSAERLRS